jgi:hypothetical protein
MLEYTSFLSSILHLALQTWRLEYVKMYVYRPPNKPATLKGILQKF